MREIPNSKKQIPRKSQGQMLKSQKAQLTRNRAFGILNFGFEVFLGFVFWNLGF
jgi:hypothetical protein